LWHENFIYQELNIYPTSSKTAFGSLKTQENLGDKKIGIANKEVMH